MKLILCKVPACSYDCGKSSITLVNVQYLGSYDIIDYYICCKWKV